MPVLLIAIIAMLIQQTVATTVKVCLPALFPAVFGFGYRFGGFALAYVAIALPAVVVGALFIFHQPPRMSR